jgi:AcrR family transcriptional regulator
MTSSLPAGLSSLPAGLRERKKAKTRATIRDVAMRLFEEQGYAATTVDQIAEAAEVSQSTFFRYFPAKEDVVLADDYDPVMIAALHAQPAGTHPIDAVIAAMREVYGRMTPEDIAAERRRQRLFQSVPELRARVMQQTSAVLQLFAEAIADRHGLPADDFSAKVMAGAIIGAVLAALPNGADGSHDFQDIEKITAALELLRDGLPLRRSREPIDEG